MITIGRRWCKRDENKGALILGAANSLHELGLTNGITVRPHGTVITLC